MCHGEAVKAFPAPAPSEPLHEAVAGYAWGSPDRAVRIAILPDIYGCNPFYRGLATRYAERGAYVCLVDPFDGLGELPEATREAAFARRHKVRDREFLDRLADFVAARKITSIVGFCLGGLYVFELARRGIQAELIGLYGFPQGLPNADSIPAPFDYLPEVSRPFSMLMGREDISVGADNVSKLEGMASAAPAMDLKLYEGVGHNFLPLLDSDDPERRSVAEDALRRMDRVLLQEAGNRTDIPRQGGGYAGV